MSLRIDSMWANESIDGSQCLMLVCHCKNVFGGFSLASVRQWKFLLKRMKRAVVETSESRILHAENAIEKYTLRGSQNASNFAT